MCNELMFLYIFISMYSIVLKIKRRDKIGQIFCQLPNFWSIAQYTPCYTTVEVACFGQSCVRRAAPADRTSQSLFVLHVKKSEKFVSDNISRVRESLS